MKRFFALAFLVSATTIAQGQSSEPEAFRRFSEALNSGDVDKLMAVLTADASVVGGPNCPPSAPCVGRELVRQNYAEYLTRVKHRSKVVSEEFKSGSSAHRVEVTNDSIRNRGTDRLIGRNEVSYRDGLIASMRFFPDMSDEETARYIKATAPPAPASK